GSASCSGDPRQHRLRHSLPTRRSSDLMMNATEHPVDLNHIRRGMGCRLQVSGHAISQGAENATGRAGFLEHLRNVLGYRGLTVGSGDPDYLQMTGRDFKEPGGNSTQLSTQPHHGHDQCAMPLMALPDLNGLEQYCCCSGGNGLVHIMLRWRLGAGKSNKRITRSHRSAVRLQPVNGDIENR